MAYCYAIHRIDCPGQKPRLGLILAPSAPRLLAPAIQAAVRTVGGHWWRRQGRRNGTSGFGGHDVARQRIL